MARKTTTKADPAPKLILTAAQIERGLARLDERIAELSSFDAKSLTSSTNPEMQALETAIKDTVERCFGVGTTAAERFKRAADLHYVSFAILSGGPRPDYARETASKISSSIALLNEAKRALKEDLADLQLDVSEPDVPSDAAKEYNRKIFLVHGHDEAALNSVARFLESIKFEVVILSEQPNKGSTIIEKIERYSDVGYAIVLLTPDDEGAKKGDTPVSRVRQNVLLELGYFIGVLGRARVSALKRDSVELPTDFAGVLWIDLDRANGWKAAIAKELQAADYIIDWNEVMRS